VSETPVLCAVLKSTGTYTCRVLSVTCKRKSPSKPTFFYINIIIVRNSCSFAGRADTATGRTRFRDGEAGAKPHHARDKAQRASREKPQGHRRGVCLPAKGPSFLARMVSSSLAVAGSGFSLKSLALALGLVAVLQSSGVGDRRYRRTTSERSSSWLGSSSPRGGRTGRLDVSLARG
jgi:hypothetical protein